MKFTESYEKLGWVIFTTIRKNTGRYKLSNIYTMITPNARFKAKVIGICPIKKKEVTDDLASVDLDVGHTKENLVDMLEHWYGKDFDDYVLITLWAQ